MPTVPIPNGKVYYFERPVPETIYPPLVLTHGAGGRYTHWPPHVRRLKGVSVHAPDLPAHGQSGGVGRDTISAYAADVMDFLDAVGIERAIIGGHSMGGAIVQQLALDCPERVAGLILVGTGAKLPVSAYILDHMLSDFDEVVTFLIKHMYGETATEALIRLGYDIMAANPPHVLLGDFLACNDFDTRPRLTEIAAPALVLGGSEDRMTPPDFAGYLAGHLPHSELHIIPRSGHMIMSEFPDQVADIITDWLAENF